MEASVEVEAWRAVRRRDRLLIVIALIGTTALAWVYLIIESVGMTAPSTEMVRLRTWETTDFALIFLMWAIMMIGMMMPSATPTTMMYAGIARKAERQGTVVAPTMVFVSGYVALWTLFSALATMAQWGLDQAALLSPMMVMTSPMIGATLLVAAGVYQASPIKLVCLEHCRSPAHFLSRHWRPGITGAFRMGLEHGVFCVGCCWVLMGLLFVGGVMNLLWIAAIAIFVFAEKIIPVRDVKTASRLSGAAMALLGLALLANWMITGS